MQVPKEDSIRDIKSEEMIVEDAQQQEDEDEQIMGGEE